MQGLIIGILNIIGGGSSGGAVIPPVGPFVWGTVTDKNWGESTTQLWGIGPPGFNFRNTDNGITRIVDNGITRIID